MIQCGFTVFCFLFNNPADVLDRSETSPVVSIERFGVLGNFQDFTVLQIVSFARSPVT